MRCKLCLAAIHGGDCKCYLNDLPTPLKKRIKDMKRIFRNKIKKQLSFRLNFDISHAVSLLREHHGVECWVGQELEQVSSPCANTGAQLNRTGVWSPLIICCLVCSCRHTFRAHFVWSLLDSVSCIPIDLSYMLSDALPLSSSLFLSLPLSSSLSLTLSLSPC